MFYMTCATCKQRWLVGEPRACICPDDEPVRHWQDLTSVELQEVREAVNSNLSISHPDYSKTLQLATQLKLKEKNHV